MMTWPFRYDVLQRFRFIEIIALWQGKLNARHLQDHFGIGRQQASKDINTYLNEVAPDNLIYDPSSKGYLPSAQFEPALSKGDFSEYLMLVNNDETSNNALTHLLLTHTPCYQLLPPIHCVKPEVIRPLFHTCCNCCISTPMSYRPMRERNKWSSKI